MLLLFKHIVEHCVHKYFQSLSILTFKKIKGCLANNFFVRVSDVCNATCFFYRDGCDMRPSEHHRTAAHMSHLRGHTLGRLPSHHHEPALPGPNNGKYATLSKQCKTLESSDFY